MITTVHLVQIESAYCSLESSPPHEELILIILIRQRLLSGILSPYDDSVSD
jgi:hypothetical protein